MLFQTDTIAFRQRIQTMGFQLRVQETGHLQGIDYRLWRFGHTIAFIAVVQKAHVKAGIVGYKNGPLGECSELLEHRFFRLGIADHIIGYARQLDGRLR